MSNIAKERALRLANENFEKNKHLLPKLNLWQKIETAPKDGTEILALAIEGMTIVAWFTLDEVSEWDSGETDLEEGFYETTLYTKDYDEFYWRVEPSHWMPLPEPPKEDE